jgi:hypothetical protein
MQCANPLRFKMSHYPEGKIRGPRPDALGNPIIRPTDNERSSLDNRHQTSGQRTTVEGEHLLFLSASRGSAANDAATENLSPHPRLSVVRWFDVDCLMNFFSLSVGPDGRMVRWSDSPWVRALPPPPGIGIRSVGTVLGGLPPFTLSLFAWLSHIRETMVFRQWRAGNIRFWNVEEPLLRRMNEEGPTGFG